MAPPVGSDGNTFDFLWVVDPGGNAERGALRAKQSSDEGKFLVDQALLCGRSLVFCGRRKVPSPSVVVVVVVVVTARMYLWAAL